ncbi:uncharacterized protein LOC119192927 isoform X2 [Manduca sexta]|uniref:uncharacterized protein LOC119192927 isoform X2 n=1 Tax=Manduca sexta TaxID=7130 RepID=UPI00188E02A8|nr:uncharacterized protein LOC119192927 isoform X2 [Manduca sexta]
MEMVKKSKRSKLTMIMLTRLDPVMERRQVTTRTIMDQCARGACMELAVIGRTCSTGRSTRTRRTRTGRRPSGARARSARRAGAATRATAATARTRPRPRRLGTRRCSATDEVRKRKKKSRRFVIVDSDDQKTA